MDLREEHGRRDKVVRCDHQGLVLVQVHVIIRGLAIASSAFQKGPQLGFVRLHLQHHSQVSVTCGGEHR